MATFIGLYYPFIHFKDEAWLKMVALYWDRVKRIVPMNYELHDSDTVKALAQELGLIQNEAPEPSDEWPVRDQFLDFLTKNTPALRQRFGLKNRHMWPVDPITSTASPAGSDKRLAYVHIDKMESDLRDALVATGLAEIGQTRDERWVGMHPRIANVYMTALAEHMTGGRGWHPITDETVDQLAVSSLSIDRIARVLLDDAALALDKPSANEIKVNLANICLETVIPKNLADVPVNKIIALRKNHKTEFTAFQTCMAQFNAEAAGLSGITDRQALAEHLELEYQNNVKPSLDNVREAFRLAKVDSAASVMSASVAVPALGVSAALAAGLQADPILGGVAGFSLALIPTIQKRREEAKAALKTPGAWLLRIEEGLKPQSLMNRVRMGARKFVLDV